MQTVTNIKREVRLLFGTTLALSICLAASRCKDRSGIDEGGVKIPRRDSPPEQSGSSEIGPFVVDQIPTKVIYCEESRRAGLVDRSNNSASSSPAGMVDIWVKTSKASLLDYEQGVRIRGLIAEAAKAPLNYFPGVGYKDGAIFLDKDNTPLYALLRFNQRGHFRLALSVFDADSGYEIDAKNSRNRVYVEAPELEDLLWK